MSGIKTPAIASIERGDLLPEDALRHADLMLEREGIDVMKAFHDPETNRHHRAVALDFLRITITANHENKEQIWQQQR